MTNHGAHFGGRLYFLEQQRLKAQELTVRAETLHNL
jgi:hypothetical protein